MPEFPSSAVEWFRARSGTEQALIGAVVLIVLAAASQVISVIAMFVFVVAAVAFVVQAMRRRPTQGWVFVALGSLATAVLFFALAGAIYGPTPQEGRSAVERAKKPATQEEPEPPGEDEDRGFGVAPRPETPMQQREDPAQEEPPEYSIVDVSIGGPGSTVALTVVAPEVEQGEEVARLAAAEYAEHDYVRVNLYASEEDVEERNSYASATVPFSERGAQRTGLDLGGMSYERR